MVGASTRFMSLDYLFCGGPPFPLNLPSVEVLTDGWGAKELCSVVSFLASCRFLIGLLCPFTDGGPGLEEESDLHRRAGDYDDGG